jgi:cell division protein FtsI (penicillin-binding protein 3)
VYPAGSVGASLVGFVARTVGRWRGGRAWGRRWRLRRVATYERSRTAGRSPGLTSEVRRAGRTVRLTIDRDLQWKVQAAVAAQVARTRAEWGSAVVLDPRTGEVLALVTVPTFDANDPGAAPEADRGNRALLDVFEPGSTSKVITVAAALQEKAVTPPPA